MTRANEPPWPDELVPLRPNGHALRESAVSHDIRLRDDRTPPRRVLSWADLLTEPDAPPPVLVPGVPKVGCTVLAGSPKVGKSLWATQQAIALGCRTLYVVEEGSLGGISYRLRRQAAALGVTAPPLSLLYRQRTRLDVPASVKALRADVETIRPALLILDPLNKSHGADENRPAEMTRVMDGLSGIAYDYGCAVLALHHLAKPSAERRGDIWDRFRGASSIRSGTDANLILDGSGTSVHLVGEFRDAEPLSEHLVLDREALIFRPADGPAYVGKVDPAALAEYVREHGPVTAQAVMAEFAVAKHTARTAIEALPGVDWTEGLRGVRAYFMDGTGH